MSSLFARLTHTRVVLAAGNHDCLRADSYYRSFRFPENVYTLFDRELQKIEFPKIHTAVSGFSYTEKEYRTGIEASWKCRRTQENEILLLHGGDEKHLPFTKREAELLGYDYAALGHIHKPDIKETGKSRYSGALEPTDVNDTGKHGFIEGTLEKGELDARFVPFAKREYIHMDILSDEHMTGRDMAEEIRRKIEEEGTENIYRLTITGFRDPDIDFAADGMDAYGNVTDILDFTGPAYNFPKLLEENRDNLLGKYIQSFQEESAGGLLEETALYEGVRALLETGRGRTERSGR